MDCTHGYTYSMCADTHTVESHEPGYWDVGTGMKLETERNVIVKEHVSYHKVTSYILFNASCKMVLTVTGKARLTNEQLFSFVICARAQTGTRLWGKWGFFSGQRQIFASEIFIHRGKFSRDFRKHGRAVPAPRTGRFSKICPPLPSFGPQAGSSPCQPTRPPCCAGWATGCSPCLHARRSTRCSPSATRSATTSPA